LNAKLQKTGHRNKPIDNVTLVNGALCGMTIEGGTLDYGTIFKISLD